jgi:hypothetical protein
MNSPPSQAESTAERLQVSDIEALGFHFDADPLASANARVAQSYFFQKPGADGHPVMRLNIARNLANDKWNITIYGRASARCDLASMADSAIHRGNIIRTATVEPKDVLSTMRQLVAEASAETQNSAVAVTNICINCGRKINNVMMDRCGLRDCDDVAAGIVH